MRKFARLAKDVERLEAERADELRTEETIDPHLAAACLSVIEGVDVPADWDCDRDGLHPAIEKAWAEVLPEMERAVKQGRGPEALAEIRRRYGQGPAPDSQPPPS